VLPPLNSTFSLSLAAAVAALAMPVEVVRAATSPVGLALEASFRAAKALQLQYRNMQQAIRSL